MAHIKLHGGETNESQSFLYAFFVFSKRNDNYKMQYLGFLTF